MDILIKALALDNQIRVYITKTRLVYKKADKLHKLSSNSGLVLSKVLSMAILMGGTLKGDQGLTIKLNGKGPIGNVVVDTNSLGIVRGYVDNPSVILQNDEINEFKTLGNNGIIDIIKDLDLKNLYSSTIPLQYPLIQDNFMDYYINSEQIVTFIGLSNLDNPGGIMIQLMPNYSENVITFLKSKLEEIYNISNLFSSIQNPHEILKHLFPDYKTLEEIKPIYKCSCNKNHFKKGIISLGAKEIEEMIIEDETAETVCNYCNKKYVFSKQELQEILKYLKEKTNE